MEKLTLNGYLVGTIHNYLIKQPDLFYKIADKIVCLTPMAKIKQKNFAWKNNLIHINQGIDTRRFEDSKFTQRKNTENILIYSRMDIYKGEIYLPIIESLLKNKKYDITILGDGEYFYSAIDSFGSSITPVSYIPCYSIHNFIRKFDVIISNGRGVMEGMLSGKPTIAAGIRYCGLIDKNNVEFFLESNFTGSNINYNCIKINDDMKKIEEGAYDNNRELGLKHFDVDDFLFKILSLTN